MPSITVKPVQIIGECPAHLTLDDTFQIDGMNLRNPHGNPLCFLAISHLPISTWQLQSEQRFFAHVSCPGCTVDPEHENRVVFLLAHGDKWKLALSISRYLALSKQVKEPEPARKLKEEAIAHQNAGDFEAAEAKIVEALAALEQQARDQRDHPVQGLWDSP